MKLNIEGLTPKEDHYIILLSNGNNKFPFVINEIQGHYIYAKLNDLYMEKNIYDVSRSITDVLNGELFEMNIAYIRNGLVYCKLLYACSMETEFNVECLFGDAICLAVANETNITITDDAMRDVKNITKRELNESKVVRLEKLLQQALDNEEYGIAANIRDELSKIK